MSNCKPFYVNILLLNKDEVVANKVTTKTGTGFLGRAAAFAANKIVTDEKILSQLAEALMDGIHKAVAEMGIETEFWVQFQQGPLVVIKVHVTEINVKTLLLAAKGADFATNFDILLNSMNALGMGDSVNEKVNEKISSSINEGMMTKFADMIPQKMSEKGVLVECTPATTEVEAEILFALLQRLQELGK